MPTGNTNTSITPTRFSPAQQLRIMRIDEVITVSDMLDHLKEGVNPDKFLEEHLVIKINKKPKSSCKHCFGRGYIGVAKVFWYKTKDGKIHIDQPAKDTGTMQKTHFMRMAPCGCVKGFRIVDIDSLDAGDMYISIVGGDVKTKEVKEDKQENLEK